MEEKLKKFIDCLEKYDVNCETSKLLELLKKNADEGIVPKVKKINWEDWLIYSDIKKSFELRILPNIASFRNRLEIHEQANDKIEQRVVTSYSFGFFNDLCVRKSKVINSFVSEEDDEYLICQGSICTSRFNDKGFQYISETQSFSYDKLLYVDGDLIRKDVLNLPNDSMQFTCASDVLRGVNFKESKVVYKVGGVHNTMLVNPRDVNDAVVIYQIGEGSSEKVICFPLFYSIDKRIVTDIFLDNPFLQLPSVNLVEGIDFSGLNSEGHTIIDLGKYLNRRKLLANKLVEANLKEELPETFESAYQLLLQYKKRK